jgi:hypothetical protein
MKGILFNEQTGMLSAAQSGLKDLTRRLGGLQEVNKNPDEWVLDGVDIKNGGLFFVKKGADRNIYQPLKYCKPRYSVGEMIFIKESHFLMPSGFRYRVDGDTKLWSGVKWSNPMFCGEKQSRYFIKIISVSVERLQDISEYDAIREGVLLMQSDGAGKIYKDYSGKRLSVSTAKESFSTLINKINGKSTWDKNPWVFRYEF